MAVSKPEVSICKLVDKIETKESPTESLTRITNLFTVGRLDRENIDIALESTFKLCIQADILLFPI